MIYKVVMIGIEVTGTEWRRGNLWLDGVRTGVGLRWGQIVVRYHCQQDSAMVLYPSWIGTYRHHFPAHWNQESVTNAACPGWPEQWTVFVQVLIMYLKMALDCYIWLALLRILLLYSALWLPESTQISVMYMVGTRFFILVCCFPIFHVVITKTAS